MSQFPLVDTPVSLVTVEVYSTTGRLTRSRRKLTMTIPPRRLDRIKAKIRAQLNYQGELRNWEIDYTRSSRPAPYSAITIIRGTIHGEGLKIVEGTYVELINVLIERYEDFLIAKTPTGIKYICFYEDQQT